MKQPKGILLLLIVLVIALVFSLFINFKLREGAASGSSSASTDFKVGANVQQCSNNTASLDINSSIKQFDQKIKNDACYDAFKKAIKDKSTFTCTKENKFINADPKNSYCSNLGVGGCNTVTKNGLSICTKMTQKDFDK